MGCCTSKETLDAPWSAAAPLAGKPPVKSPRRSRPSSNDTAKASPFRTSTASPTARGTPLGSNKALGRTEMSTPETAPHSTPTSSLGSSSYGLPSPFTPPNSYVPPNLDPEDTPYYHMTPHEAQSFEHHALRAILGEARTTKQSQSQRFQVAFRNFDRSNRGQITRGNLRAVLGAENSLYINALVEQADADRDGLIDYDDFCKVLRLWAEAGDVSIVSTEERYETVEIVTDHFSPRHSGNNKSLRKNECNARRQYEEACEKANSKRYLSTEGMNDNDDDDNNNKENNDVDQEEDNQESSPLLVDDCPETTSDDNLQD